MCPPPYTVYTCRSQCHHVVLVDLQEPVKIQGDVGSELVLFCIQFFTHHRS